MKTHILNRCQQESKNSLHKKAEFIFLTIDLLSCPYLDEVNDTFKIKILNCCGFPRLTRQEQQDILEVIRVQRYWFTKWRNFNLMKELNGIKGQEVY